MRDFKGSNYDSSLTVKEIAKTVRQFIRKEFKGFKFSVTSTRNVIRVDLIGSFDETRYLDADGNNHLTEFGRTMREKIKDFVESYNFDKSNPMEDYFFVNFYSYISI